MPDQDLLCEKTPTPMSGFQEQGAIAQACCQDQVRSHTDDNVTEILKHGCNLWFINCFSLKWKRNGQPVSLEEL